MAESESHRRWAVQNRIVNPIVRMLLRSPLHRLASGRLLLLTVTGRKSGKQYTFPTRYQHLANQVHVVPQWPKSKRWWRNLTGEGARVGVLIEGEQQTGWAEVRGDEEIGVSVEIQLDEPAAPS